MDSLTAGEVQMMLTRTPEEQRVFLVKLDTLKMQTIEDEDAQTDYQLENWDLLRGGDLVGWVTKFLPHFLPTISQPHRTRMSPNRVKYCPRQVCVECKGETFDDVLQGRVVCGTCGLIQSSSMLVSDVDTAVFGIQVTHHPRGSIFVIHEYSRIVYFVSVLNVYQGVTTPTILTSDFLNLQKKCMELCAGDRDRVNPQIVRAAIHFLKLPKKHLRHSHTLAGKIGSPKAGLLQIDGNGVSHLLKAFRLVEIAWDEKKVKIQKEFNRKSFFNYRFLLGALVTKLGLTVSPFTMKLKTPKLQISQENLFNFVTFELDFSGIRDRLQNSVDL